MQDFIDFYTRIRLQSRRCVLIMLKEVFIVCDEEE